MFHRTGKRLIIAFVGVCISIPLLANATVTSVGPLSPSSDGSRSLYGTIAPHGHLHVASSLGPVETNSVSPLAPSFEIPGLFGLTPVEVDSPKLGSSVPLDSGSSFSQSVDTGYVGGSGFASLTLLSGNYFLQFWGSPMEEGSNHSRTLDLSSVPEPEVWAMLLIGAGLTGNQVRRKLKAGPIKIVA